MTQSLKRAIGWPAAVLAAAALLPLPASAQTKTFLVPGQGFAPAVAPPPCRGKVTQVADLAYENVKTTAWNFANVGGGGIGGRFDPLPVLSTAVTLQAGCLNAHFSAMAGSTIYGVSNMTLFEITLTSPSGALIPLIGHYPTPYGLPSPAVALSAEYDVDMLGSNFYIPVGTTTGAVPPGTYKLNVWWAGGPTAAGGAIGAAFVLKLYQQ